MNDEYASIHRSPSAVAITARGPYMRKELSSVLNKVTSVYLSFYTLCTNIKKQRKQHEERNMSLNDLKRLAYHANLIEQPKPTVL